MMLILHKVMDNQSEIVKKLGLMLEPHELLFESSGSFLLSIFVFGFLKTGSVINTFMTDTSLRIFKTSRSFWFSLVSFRGRQLE